MSNFVSLAYLIASVLFILSLRGLSHPNTARRGNLYGMIGMALVVFVTAFSSMVHSYTLILAGVLIGGTIGTTMAKKAKMTELPELVALFNGFGGFASVFVALSAFFNPEAHGIGTVGQIATKSVFEIALSILIGGVTFSGSLIAYGKLKGIVKNNFLRFPKQYILNAALLFSIFILILMLAGAQSASILWLMIAVTLVLGILLVTPIGGADMPVVISMLNSYSGFAAVAVGFTLENTLLIIVGSLVGASGAILSYIMCQSMNRSFFNVIMGGFGETASVQEDDTDKVAKMGSADDAAFIMKNAADVIIVPGYGMAVAQAQHATKEMADMLKAEGVRVRYAIHPVAGRMPGHMNVLLAEANVPYDDVFEMDDINRDFAQADVAFVIGANDITNPAAKDDPASPIAGMPVLDVGNAKTVLFVKRSLGAGYAGIDNRLFYADNTMMLLDNGKKMVENIVKALSD